ncbi:hypothetical protein [Brevibacillus migulae]|uniref:hypothetical protein n=1 Tax=Brevibacillus migulae TaxID=1644114 RepID=UPI00196B89C4|nr:hypothetical protein [Brevibacillus migulae]
MFSEKLGLTLLFSLLIWFGATVFFVCFGSMVLVNPFEQSFLLRFVLLEAATCAVLYGVFVVFRMLDSSPYAAVRLGLIGSAVGLLIDACVLWNRDVIFPHLSSEQLIAFTIWMAFAYGLYLLIPLFMGKGKKGV